MKKIDKAVLAALNVPETSLNFIRNLPDFACEIEEFNSPEGMVPWLNHYSGLVVILVNADSLLNQGHNEIDKLIDLFQIEPILSVNPVIALTSNLAETENIILKKQFAQDTVSIPSDPKTVVLKLQNVIEISRTRYKIEMDFLTKQETENRKKLLALQEIDKETGIFNREAFSRRTQEMIRANPDKKYILVRWDIDRFKVYNDTFGVHAGDILLKAIGRAYIEKNLQSVTYGHWVSDHFVMCMEEKMFSSVAVHKYISEQMSLYRPDFEFIVRMGVYRVTDVNTNVTLMCDRALLAMKSIKNDFEKRIAYYDDSMRGELMEEQELITEMEPAIANKEFHIYFQPQYNYVTGKMSGAEALVRWIHPVKGMISPGKFIPVFEKNGFICRLDEYIWERVCQSIRKWIDQGLKIVPVSVNISRRDIYNPELCSIISGLTEKYGIHPSLLRLEITESAYMEEPTQLIKIVEKLKSAGFTIEMDDFGSGYSSLNTLKDVPVDILKLDLKFLEDAGKSKRGGSILTSVVRMANWLTLPIIAEGIETAEQAEFLKSIGCYTMQGYLFSRPIPEEDFLKLMEAAELETCEDEAISADLANAIDFINPATQNALLFNSFVGGAAIVEYTGNHIDAIRINDKFFETIGVTREEYHELPFKCLGVYSEKYEDSFKEMLDEAKLNGKEAACILHLDEMKKGYGRVWTRNRARYLASAGDTDIYYVAVENISQMMRLNNENSRITKELITIVDNVPCGIMRVFYPVNKKLPEDRSTDLEMYEQLEEKPILSFANKPVVDMYGYASLEELKTVFNNNLPGIYAEGEYRKMIYLFRQTALQKKSHFSFTLKLQRKNGTQSLCAQQGTISYDEDGARVTAVVLDLSQQIYSDINKFAQVLSKIYDETFIINYETDAVRYINSSMKENIESVKTEKMSEMITSRIKNFVLAEDRKKLAKFMDLEYVKSIQANGEVPHVEYKVLFQGRERTMTSSWLQADKAVYVVCNKFSD